MDEFNPMDIHDAALHLQRRPPPSAPETLGSSVVPQWLEQIHQCERQSTRDDPNYFVANPESLVSKSAAQDFMVGTGDDIFEHIVKAIENAESEIILITCFWARSKSLELLGRALCNLSASTLERGQPKVRVRIGLSSLSLWQKLFQTSNLLGRTYDKAEWGRKLWLPPSTELHGLDIKIKSIFVRPFSVMHPKFVIIDRRQIWLPSCNVSWETWFEGCIVLTGPIISQFVSFWQNFWARSEKTLDIKWPSTPSDSNIASSLHTFPRHLFSLAYSSLQSTGKPLYASPQALPALFLPSPHHKNPRFRLIPWSKPAPPPPTPLNLFLLTLLENAKSSISIQTPNLTSPPVLSAILSALQRGVHVGVLTSESLMVAEQFVTAGTTTSRCVRTLIRRYKKLRSDCQRRPADIEGARPQLGTLEIEYFQPLANRGTREPVQSHIKLTIVDAEWVVLGSGNLDRASWYTSQELGVAFHDTQLAICVAEIVGSKLSGRTRVIFDSDAS